MATKRMRWNKLGRFATGLIVLCFFMPFFGVSCDGMDVVTISGADMVGGCKPGGLISESNDRGKSKRGGSLDAKVDNVKIEPIAIIAFALALGGFAVAWSRSRKALTGSFAIAVASVAVLVVLYIKVGGELKDAVAVETASSKSSKIGREMNIDAGSRWGLWLACLSLIGVAAMTGQALREKDDGTAPALPPPAPPIA